MDRNVRRLLVYIALISLVFGAAGAAPQAVRRHVVRALPLSDGGKFMFIAYGDTRSYPDDHSKVISEIIRLHPEFVLQSGDLVDNGRNAAEWKQFNQITQPLRDAHIAYYPVRGNHDVGPYYTQFVTEPFDSGNKFYYAFTRHHNRFLMLDSMDPDEFAPGSAQYQWLVEQLTQAQKTAVNTFVMFHEGPFSIGPHGPTPDAQQNLHPLFVKYHPRAVFNGHDHLYYRTTRDGVRYLVTGGGGAPLYDPVRAQALAIPGDVYANTHHIIRCDVDGAQVTFTVVALDNASIFPAPFHPGDTPSAVSVVGAKTTQTTPIPISRDGYVIDHFILGPKS